MVNKKRIVDDDDDEEDEEMITPAVLPTVPKIENKSEEIASYVVKEENEQISNSSFNVSSTPIRSRKRKRSNFIEDDDNDDVEDNSMIISNLNMSNAKTSTSDSIKQEEIDNDDDDDVSSINEDDISVSDGSDFESSNLNGSQLLDDDNSSDDAYNEDDDEELETMKDEKDFAKYVKNESDEEMPTNVKKTKKTKTKKETIKKEKSKKNGKKTKKVKDEEESEEDLEPSKKKKKTSKTTSVSTSKKKTKETKSTKKETSKKDKGKKKIIDDDNDEEEEEVEEYKWWVEESFEKIKAMKSSSKWKTLEWNGVIFPPEYKPHGRKVLYKGKPVTLKPKEEEIATMYGILREFDYYDDEVFKKNFFKSWKEVLGKNHIIKELKHCNFDNIWQWNLEQKEIKDKKTKEEKKKEKEEKAAFEEKYKYATIDGRKELISNFTVEPPGLFRGRGKHPKRGILKKRVYPNEVTINIGKKKDAPKPPKGYKWKEIVSNNTVSWLASYKNNLNEVKYVQLARSSSFKGRSDFLKFEIARRLKDKIDKIRKTYRKDWLSKDPKKMQLAVALYFIDKLALRNGNEKDKDEADTVGCCSLRVEHITLEEDNKVSFDFLGKDSIRYTNTIEIEEQVHKNLKKLVKKKKKTDQLFDQVNTMSLNDYTKQFYEDLTAKVFRTFNASFTLQKELEKTDDKINKMNVTEKVAYFNAANREVAILCNHQRAAPKTFDRQMTGIDKKIEFEENFLKKLKKAKKDLKTKDYEDMKKNVEEQYEKELKKWEKEVETQEKEYEKEKKKAQKENKSVPKALPKPPKPPKLLLPKNDTDIDKRIEKLEKKIKDMKTKKKMKVDNKTVSLSTSKINYCDPRITVAWCKKHDVPITRIFTKTIQKQFPWCMDTEADWKF